MTATTTMRDNIVRPHQKPDKRAIAPWLDTYQDNAGRDVLGGLLRLLASLTTGEGSRG